ncbi:hypothetical protein EGH82_17860 [Vibrio ponticus]|uniref:Uncharacterized protein n=1 Tax=Vibrio ponticus TaxID=265668 RepID=A0A3N3DVZ4_9VIBR|nr:hypothetical protein [Vibrio ponticus]ROV58572.1 hypothetical protein EGH82_17860 [Vibrio ponticus]
MKTITTSELYLGNAGCFKKLVDALGHAKALDYLASLLFHKMLLKELSITYLDIPATTGNKNDTKYMINKMRKLFPQCCFRYSKSKKRGLPCYFIDTHSALTFINSDRDSSNHGQLNNQ